MSNMIAMVVFEIRYKICKKQLYIYEQQGSIIQAHNINT